VLGSLEGNETYILYEKLLEESILMRPGMSRTMRRLQEWLPLLIDPVVLDVLMWFITNRIGVITNNLMYMHTLEMD
jgi:hypothetical protein